MSGVLLTASQGVNCRTGSAYSNAAALTVLVKLVTGASIPSGKIATGGGASNSFLLQTDGSGNLQIAIWGKNGASNFEKAKLVNGVLATNTTYYIALRWSGSADTIWCDINGSSKTVSNWFVDQPVTNLFTQTANAYFGGGYGATGLAGTYSLLAVFTNKISDADATAFGNGTKTPDQLTGTMVLYVKADVRAGISDSSGNGYFVSSNGSCSDDVSFLGNLMSWWEFQQAAGAVRYDSHSYVDLTDNNTVGRTTGPTGIPYCADFTQASSQKLTAAAAAACRPGTGDHDFSWCGWFYLKDKSALYVVFENEWASGAGNGSAQIQIYYDNGADRFKANWYTSAGNTTATLSALGSPTAGTWYFLRFKYVSSTKVGSLGYNAVSFSDTATGGAAPPSASDTVNQIFGANSGGNYANARYTGTGLFSAALSDSDFATLYNGGTVLPYPFAGGAPPAGILRRSGLDGLGRKRALTGGCRG